MNCRISIIRLYFLIFCCRLSKRMFENSNLNCNFNYPEIPMNSYPKEFRNYYQNMIINKRLRDATP